MVRVDEALEYKCKCDKAYSWDNVTLHNGDLLFHCHECNTSIEIDYSLKEPDNA